MKSEVPGPLAVEKVGVELGLSGEFGAHSQERFFLQMLMDNIPDGIYFKDAASRFLCVNRAQAKRFGLSDPAQAIGKTDADFFSAKHAQQALADEQRVLHTGQPLVGIEEMETWPDGLVTWASTTKMPLRDATGRIIGTFGISRDITLRKRAELALAERTRQLQQKTQQMEEELRMARELQLAMLPRGKKHGALEFFTFYSPCRTVSGDFFDVIELSPEKVGVFICDVMGHDVRAALITGMMRALVEDLSGVAGNPGQLLAQINHGLTGVFKQSGATMYATAFYLVADTAQGRMQYASAAHPDPLFIRRPGLVERLGDPARGHRGPALGLFEKAEFPTLERDLASGDLIALFTDGLIEAESPHQKPFSEAELVAAVTRSLHLPAKQLFSELIAEVCRFSGRAEFDDDVCLVGVEVKKLGKEKKP